MGHGIEDKIKSLIFRFKEVLDPKEGILKCFTKYGIQVEGWFKGEFIYFLDNEKAMGRLLDFEREVPLEMGKKKVDFRVEIPANSGIQEAWIELKHWLIGYQKGRNIMHSFTSDIRRDGRLSLRN